RRDTADVLNNIEVAAHRRDDPSFDAQAMEPGADGAIFAKCRDYLLTARGECLGQEGNMDRRSGQVRVRRNEENGICHARPSSRASGAFRLLEAARMRRSHSASTDS